MTTLKIEDGNLIINVQGADQLWALKSRLIIPLKHITGVSYEPEIARGWWHGFKLPGTQVPGVITAGTFYRHGEWTFWDVHNPENTIKISLKDEHYQNLVVEVKDPEKAIAEINAGLGEKCG
ncbi:MAG: hypothetical protein ACR2I2_18405 [Bryobacteraceae bacterium]